MATKRATSALSIGPSRVGGGVAAATTAWVDRSQGAEPPARIPGRVIVWAPEIGLTVVARHNVAPQVVDEPAASGAWSVTPRTKRSPVTAYAAEQPLRVAVELLLDGWIEQRNVAPEIRALRTMEVRISGAGAPPRPPWLRVIGVMPVLPTSATAIRWGIDGIAIEEGKERIDGVPARAVAKITLLRLATPEVQVRMSPATLSAKRHTKPWLRGDTLAKFAGRWLGGNTQDARDALRRANPSIKRWSAVKAGAHVVVPAVRQGIEFGPTSVGSAVGRG